MNTFDLTPKPQLGAARASGSLGPVCALLVLASLSACDVEHAPGDTGGAAEGSHGLLVFNSDYQSSSVSLVDAEGGLLSPSFISSGSERPGLSAALGSDLVPPSAPVPAGEPSALLIDRGNAVLTWVDLESATVKQQLDVSTGFDANPHDFVSLSEDKAYVVRFSKNFDAGKQAFDAGEDVLVVDPKAARITGRISLGADAVGLDARFAAMPDRAIAVGERTFVTLNGLAPDYSDAAEGRVAILDNRSDSLAGVQLLEGYRNCGAIAVNEEGTRLAVGCTGFFRQEPTDGWPDAGVVLLDIQDQGLREIARFSSEDLAHCSGDACQPTQPSGLAFAPDGRLLVATYGVFEGGEDGDVSYPGQALLVDVDSRERSTLFESGAFDVGGPDCMAERCFVPDAKPGVLRVFELTGATVRELEYIHVDTQSGLPPRHLQRF